MPSTEAEESDWLNDYDDEVNEKQKEAKRKGRLNPMPYNAIGSLPGEFDTVKKPKHYNSHPSGIECITITKHMNFCRGTPLNIFGGRAAREVNWKICGKPVNTLTMKFSD